MTSLTGEKVFPYSKKWAIVSTVQTPDPLAYIAIRKLDIRKYIVSITILLAWPTTHGLLLFPE